MSRVVIALFFAILTACTSAAPPPAPDGGSSSGEYCSQRCNEAYEASDPGDAGNNQLASNIWVQCIKACAAGLKQRDLAISISTLSLDPEYCVVSCQLDWNCSGPTNCGDGYAGCLSSKCCDLPITATCVDMCEGACLSKGSACYVTAACNTDISICTDACPGGGGGGTAQNPGPSVIFTPESGCQDYASKCNTPDEVQAYTEDCVCAALCGCDSASDSVLQKDLSVLQQQGWTCSC